MCLNFTCEQTQILYQLLLLAISNLEDFKPNKLVNYIVFNFKIMPKNKIQ